MTDEEPDDPFDDESIAEGDEIDDPFARLDDGPEAGTPGGEEPDPDDAEGTLFGEATTPDRDPVDAGETGDDAPEGERASARDPFDDLGPATGESDADLDEAFERMDVGDLAEEDVWESLDEDAADGFGPVGEGGGAASEADATGGSGGGFGARGTGVERVVSKRTYCQQCPHFSAPPEVACDHEGTSILESVGFDEFRVRNCPMVDDGDPTFDADGDA